MIAINWYEVLLPQEKVFEIPVERFESSDSIPKRKHSIMHRTILRSTDDTSIVYHITASDVDRANIEDIDFERAPSIGKYTIEHGFAVDLQDVGFNVILRHIGGTAYRCVDRSALPKIYDSTEGIKFRCFYGFGTSEPNKRYRWGLILSYITGQYFKISLKDHFLRKLSAGKRIIPLQLLQKNESNQSSNQDNMSPGIFKSAYGDKGVLVDKEGTELEISLDEWTLPCSYGILLDYIRGTKGAKSASDVFTKIQLDALTLTSEKRMNTALARDQYNKLHALMSDNDLYTFHLALPDKPLVRLSAKPLALEE